jgi:hypothetical protein
MKRVGAGERIERAFGQRQQLRLAVAVGEHREGEEVEPVSIGSLKASSMRGVSSLPLRRSSSASALAAVAAEVRVQHVDHRPEVTAFLDVDLEQGCAGRRGSGNARRANAAVRRCGLGIALDDDQRRSWLRNSPGHFLPHRLALEIAEADARSCVGSARKMPQRYSGQSDVIEVRPSRRIDADGGAQIDLVDCPGIPAAPSRATNPGRLAASARARAAGACRSKDQRCSGFFPQRSCYVLLKSNEGRPSRP